MKTRILAAGLAAALAVGLSACSAGNPAQEATINGYFAGIGAGSPKEMTKASDHAAKDSLAAQYSFEQVGHAQARQDGGTLTGDVQEVVIEGEVVLLCSAGHDAEGAPREEFCAEYSDLVFDEAHKLVDFSVAGKPLKGRIAAGDATTVPVADAGTVTYLNSYVTMADDLVVVVEIESHTDPLRIMSFNATYVPESGRPVSVNYADGPTELKAERVGNVAFRFPSGELGGVLEIAFMDADYNNFEVEIPTAK